MSINIESVLDTLKKLQDIRLEMFNMYLSSTWDKEGLHTDAVESVTKLMISNLETILEVLKNGDDLPIP